MKRENFREVVSFKAAGSHTFAPLTNGVVPEKWEITANNTSNNEKTVVVALKDAGVATIYEESETAVATTETEDLGTVFSSHDEIVVTVSGTAGDMASNPIIIRCTAGPDEGGVNAAGFSVATDVT